MTIEQILDLEQLEVNIYRGGVYNPESGFLSRTFGGHIAGQALVSAVRTVDPKYQVHSLHGYFLRPGDGTKPAVYLVDRPRDGSSFCTRRVNAVQNGEVIFSMGASFQTTQDGIEHQDEMPRVVSPDDLVDARSGESPFGNGGIAQFAEWDIRRVPQHRVTRQQGEASQQQVWFKHRDPLPDDPLLHQALLAYASDWSLMSVAMRPHALSWQQGNVQGVSLDHAMWFHRDFRFDDWLLYQSDSPSLSGARGFCRGSLWRRDGALVASVAQEGLIRIRRPAQAG